ncbi:hypothetical protein UFOVP1333_56 [uncultured Caudovirales phage]|uniref:Uncharacterized protein n=1 Tax=uncultured Caudovirales phage TaxID=2100421 RepID=A0A6J5S2Z5_9CAUD|nr:hypothetical protein UFOVP1333_56 [uncultured Caudovirales phage]
MERIACPTCGRLKPDFAIRSQRCRDDIWDEQQLGDVKAQASWERRKAANARDTEQA